MPLTTNDFSVQLCDRQQKVNHENSCGRLWEMVKLELRIFEKDESVTGKATNSDLNLGASETALSVERMGYNLSKNTSFLYRLEITISCLSVLRLVLREVITFAIKWVGFFCDHLSDFPFKSSFCSHLFVSSLSICQHLLSLRYPQCFWYRHKITLDL